MALSFPLTPPATGFVSFIPRARSIVGQSTSIYTAESQYSVQQGEWWEADVVLPPMLSELAEPWCGFLCALNGKEGTFYMGVPLRRVPRGNITGSVVVSGAGQTGKTLVTSGGTGTIKAGDYFQLGTGASSHLHKVVQDSATGTWEIWPRLRVAPTNGSAIVLSNPTGVWRLASNDREWSLDQAVAYGIQFSCREDL